MCRLSLARFVPRRPVWVTSRDTPAASRAVYRRSQTSLTLRLSLYLSLFSVLLENKPALLCILQIHGQALAGFLAAHRHGPPAFVGREYLDIRICGRHQARRGVSWIALGAVHKL